MWEDGHNEMSESDVRGRNNLTTISVKEGGKLFSFVLFDRV